MQKIFHYIHLLFLSTFLIAFGQLNAQCVFEVDFHDWIQEGYPGNGNWNISPDGKEVVQSVNGDPTFFVSQDTFMNVRIYGQIEVGNNWDDDFVGFVFGYVSPNSGTAQDDYEFYLFDWKQQAQQVGAAYCNARAEEGFTLTHYDNVITNDNCPLYLSFWQHQDNPPKVEVIKSVYGNGLGWNYDQAYNFELTYTSTKIIISVNSDTIFNIDGCYEPGRFGFYNFSKEAVTYSNFNYALATEYTIQESPLYWVCHGDSVHFESVDLSCSTVPTNIVSWEWNLGDGNISNDINPTYLYPNVGDYEVKLVMTDYLGCQDSMSHIVSVKPLPVIMDTLITDTNYFCDNYPGRIDLISLGGSGDSVVWYTDGCGTNKIGIGDTLDIVAPIDSTIYYARYEGYCGSTLCDTLEVFVWPSSIEPDSVHTDANNYCSGTQDSILLTAFGGWGDTLRWYSESCGGTYLGKGDSLKIAAPLDTLSYFARWENTCSFSNCTSVEVVVYPLPQPDIIGPDTLCGFTAGVNYFTQDNSLLGNSYLWLVTDAALLGPDDKADINLSFPNGPVTSQLVVQEINHLTCLNSDTLQVVIHPKPGAIPIFHD